MQWTLCQTQIQFTDPKQDRECLCLGTLLSWTLCDIKQHTISYKTLYGTLNVHACTDVAEIMHPTGTMWDTINRRNSSAVISNSCAAAQCAVSNHQVLHYKFSNVTFWSENYHSFMTNNAALVVCLYDSDRHNTLTLFHYKGHLYFVFI